MDVDTPLHESASGSTRVLRPRAPRGPAADDAAYDPGRAPIESPSGRSKSTGATKSRKRAKQEAGAAAPTIALPPVQLSDHPADVAGDALDDGALLGLPSAGTSSNAPIESSSLAQILAALSSTDSCPETELASSLFITLARPSSKEGVSELARAVERLAREYGHEILAGAATSNVIYSDPRGAVRLLVSVLVGIDQALHDHFPAWMGAPLAGLALALDHSPTIRALVATASAAARTLGRSGQSVASTTTGTDQDRAPAEALLNEAGSAVRTIISGCAAEIGATVKGVQTDLSHSLIRNTIMVVGIVLGGSRWSFAVRVQRSRVDRV